MALLITKLGINTKLLECVVLCEDKSDREAKKEREGGGRESFSSLGLGIHKVT